jgi:hypothetical protein
MATLPIFFGHREASVEAAMVFPREPQKAAAFAAWLILRDVRFAQEHGSRGLIDAGLRDEDSAKQMLEVALAASDFAYLVDEARRNVEDGMRAGVITACLYSLACDNLKTASWRKAVELAEGLTQSYNVKRGTRLPATRSQFSQCLTAFRPALHLLGARTLRRRGAARRDAVDRILDLNPDPSVGYLAKHDLLFFLLEAKTLQAVLHEWDKGHSPRSQHLAEMFEIDGTWSPPPKQPEWPDRAGRLRRLLVDPDKRLTQRKGGRPPKPRSK